MDSVVVTEAERVAARAWEREPDSATYLLWGCGLLALGLAVLLRAQAEFWKEITRW